ncbi:MAG: hypothetical protein V3V00_07795 [Saprospiraceae bacterium]
MKVKINKAQYLIGKIPLVKIISDYPLKILLKKRKNGIGWINMSHLIGQGKEIILTEGNK